MVNMIVCNAKNTLVCLLISKTIKLSQGNVKENKKIVNFHHHDPLIDSTKISVIYEKTPHITEFLIRWRNNVFAKSKSIQNSTPKKITLDIFRNVVGRQRWRRWCRVEWGGARPWNFNGFDFHCSPHFPFNFRNHARPLSYSLSARHLICVLILNHSRILNFHKRKFLVVSIIQQFVDARGWLNEGKSSVLRAISTKFWWWYCHTRERAKSLAESEFLG